MTKLSCKVLVEKKLSIFAQSFLFHFPHDNKTALFPRQIQQMDDGLLKARLIRYNLGICCAFVS